MSLAARPVEDRFWEKLVEGSVPAGLSEPCWNWTGCVKKPEGYGLFFVKVTSTKPLRTLKVRAHRFAYELLRGEVPAGLDLDHLCRNRACCNPTHLEPVTRSINLRRSPLVGKAQARKTHCAQGHAFTPENTYIHTRKRNNNFYAERQCRTCSREKMRRKAHVSRTEHT